MEGLCQSQNTTVPVEHVRFWGALGSNGRAAGATPRRDAEEQLGRQIAYQFLWEGRGVCRGLLQSDGGDSSSVSS